MGLQAAHDGLELGHLLGRHAVALVEHERGAELDLLDEKALDVVLLDVVGEKGVATVELVVHAGAVDHGHDVVQVERSRAALGLVADGRDGVGNGDGLADARGLDDDVVEVAGLGDGRELLRQVGGKRAADAAVAHGDEAVRGGEAAVLDEACVNVNLADVVHDDGGANALVVGKDVVEERGLARSQVTGKHDDLDRSRGVLRGHGCPLLPARETLATCLVNWKSLGHTCGEIEGQRATRHVAAVQLSARRLRSQRVAVVAYGLAGHGVAGLLSSKPWSLGRTLHHNAARARSPSGVHEAALVVTRPLQALNELQLLLDGRALAALGKHGVEKDHVRREAQRGKRRHGVLAAKLHA